MYIAGSIDGSPDIYDRLTAAIRDACDIDVGGDSHEIPKIEFCSVSYQHNFPTKKAQVSLP